MTLSVTALTDNAPDYIRAIAPYQPGKPISELAREMGLNEADIVKLASNENPLGMGPKAQEAAENAVYELGRYPDGNGFVLKNALVEHYGVVLNQIVLGNGSNDILELVARAFLAPGASAVYSQYAFSVYPLATQGAGAQGIEVPALNYGHDLEAMKAAIRPDTRVVFIANPNNPTGTFIDGKTLEAFIAAVPAHVLVVLDEAYTEYLPPDVRYNAIGWLQRYPNLLISRTFSKAYGLAGLRVGFALCSAEVADLLNRVRQPFNVNSIALAAAAASLNDAEFLQRSYALNQLGLQQLSLGLSTLGLEFIPSRGNFILFKVANAAKVNQELLKRGVIIRPVAGYGLPDWLRVSAGLANENARFLSALNEVLGEIA